jgi:glutamyl-tRNA synthetase
VSDGRFAPSPTGTLHLGNLRTALLAWLFARSAGSRFLVRMEDLDTGRVRPGLDVAQLEDLAALGIDWDGPVEYQSSRGPLYASALARLRGERRLYECYCTRAEIREAASAAHGPLPEGAYPGTCLRLSASELAERRASGRPPALRVRADGASVAFSDRLLGRVEGVVDDFVVRRGDGAYAYNLAVVVDDAAQGVDLVVRGDDLLPSTPTQVAILRALGHSVPRYAHVPLVVGEDGRRLAKRDGAITLHDLAATGVSLDVVRSALAASIGIAGARESVTARELVDRFDLVTFAARGRSPVSVKNLYI